MQSRTEPNFSLVPYRLVVDDDVSVIGEGVDNWSGLFWRIATIASSGFNWVSWNSCVPLRFFYCLNMALYLLHVCILFSAIVFTFKMRFFLSVSFHVPQNKIGGLQNELRSFTTFTIWYGLVPKYHIKNMVFWHTRGHP